MVQSALAQIDPLHPLPLLCLTRSRPLLLPEIFQGYQTAHMHNWNQVSLVKDLSSTSLPHAILLISQETSSEGNVLESCCRHSSPLSLRLSRVFSCPLLVCVSIFPTTPPPPRFDLLTSLKPQTTSQLPSWMIWLQWFLAPPVRFEFLWVSEDGSPVHLHHVPHESQHAEGRPPVPVRTALSKPPQHDYLWNPLLDGLWSSRDYMLECTTKLTDSIYCIMQCSRTVSLTLPVQPFTKRAPGCRSGYCVCCLLSIVKTLLG